MRTAGILVAISLHLSRAIASQNKSCAVLRLTPRTASREACGSVLDAQLRSILTDSERELIPAEDISIFAVDGRGGG